MARMEGDMVGSGTRERAKRNCARAITATLVLFALVLGGGGVAIASPPALTIDHPLPGSSTNNQTPAFSGGTSDTLDQVTLKLYAGAGTGGQPVQTATTPLPPAGGTWAITLASALEPGQYTAVAEQTNLLKGTGSTAVTFRVDTTPPIVSINALASPTKNSTPTLAGGAENDEGDIQTVAVTIYQGNSAGGTVAASANVPASGGAWSYTTPHLSDGTYTARATQSDEAGNAGISSPVTFTVTTPPPTLPLASFSWFPRAPKVGETVSLVSTSTDTHSPITAFAWALTSSGAFHPGKPILSTSFPTRGPHVVRLRVTDADGLSSVVAETINVTPRPLVLMQPFPIVRIAGSDTAVGAKITLLTVQAPLGARVRVSCHGRSCPTHSESRVAFSTKRKARGTVQIAFRRFERSLRAGVMLEIRVYKHGQIGKYTRFVIRTGRLPERVDTCLGPTGTKPMACPY